MKVINAKTLQLAIEKIDEYRAKYRKEGESFGFHFSGEQKQGWTDSVIKNKMLYVPYGSTTSPKFNELQPYADLRVAKAEGKDVGEIPEPWVYPYSYFTAKLILNPSTTSCEVTFDLIKSDGSSESTICDLGWVNNNEILWFAKIESNNGATFNQVEQVRITVTDQSTNQPSPFYIQYINFSNNELLKYSGPINILDGIQLDKYLQSQSGGERKFIFDKYSNISEMFDSKTSDNRCSTCDMNVCFCYGTARYGYSPCATDTCNGYQECTCNASCHLQESNRCVCDHMFYSVEAADPARVLSTPIAQNVDLLAKVKPQLENLTQTGPNTYKKINSRLPGYLHYTFDTPYILKDDANKKIQADNIRVLSKTQTKNWTADIKRDPRFEGAKLFFLGVGNHDYVIVAQLTRGIPTENYWQWGWDPSTRSYLYGDRNSIEFVDGDNNLGVSYDILIYEIHPGVSSYYLDLIQRINFETAVSQGEQQREKIPMDFCDIHVYETSCVNEVLKYSIVVSLSNHYIGNGFLSTTCFSLDSEGTYDFIKRSQMSQTWYRDYQTVINAGEPFYFLCIHDGAIFTYTMVRSSYNTGYFRKLFRNFTEEDDPLYSTENWHFIGAPLVNPTLLQGLRNLEMYAPGMVAYGKANSYRQPRTHTAGTAGVVEYNYMIGVLYQKVDDRPHNSGSGTYYTYHMPATMRSPLTRNPLIFNGEILTIMTTPPASHGYLRCPPHIKLLFEYIQGEDKEAVYGLDVAVNNAIYHTDNATNTSNDVSWQKILRLNPDEYICCIGFTQYFEGTNKFFIYKNMDGNLYLKPLFGDINSQTSDKGILISGSFNEGNQFVSLSNNGILSTGSISANIGSLNGVREMSTGGDFQTLSIELNNHITEFKEFSLLADSIYYKQDSSIQAIPCSCNQAQYYGQSCVCDEVCDSYTYTCFCYAKSY